ELPLSRPDHMLPGERELLAVRENVRPRPATTATEEAFGHLREGLLLLLASLVNVRGISEELSLDVVLLATKLRHLAIQVGVRGVKGHMRRPSLGARLVLRSPVDRILCEGVLEEAASRCELCASPDQDLDLLGDRIHLR